ncbi:hypothetical protein F7R01_00960 [Pseudomonas argentinensis]|uniref:Uncharacterized protein n=1 Tax=Phytopseudomonas argentinensis TaxID=289370 RepID=A0A1I3NRN4_9GAMM|nr:hypothetical protein [Pseudomonas argentinensis]KAB0549825.1 hypothetical protein F7R01_00960 [Pseudomonas argentinensis]SFJ11943.1 hypothetical protein SAMN05216602_3982 [Pseudomonas argentinensis]
MWARVEYGIVVEVTGDDPQGRFHPSLLWVDCPSSVDIGWTLIGDEWREPDLPSPNEEEILRRKLRANNASYTAATLALTADYPQLEKDTWPTQNEQAAAWVADPEGAVTPWIDLAAIERGIDREEYLRRTLVKAEQFKILSAFLTGRRQRYEDKIKAGGDPLLDYALTAAVRAQLQQVAIDGMSLPAAELKGVL